MKDKLLDYIRSGKSPSRMTWLIIAVVIAMAFAIGNICKTQTRIRDQKERLEQLSAEIQLQQGENEALDALLNNGSEYIERRAREDLDMVLPGERVYIIRAGS